MIKLIALLVVLSPAAQADFLGDLVHKLTGSSVSSTLQIEDISVTTPTSVTPEPELGEKLSRAAHIRVLDKRTNRLTDLTFKTTAPQSFGDIKIQIKNCRRHHHQVGHHAAWFTIMGVMPESDTNVPETQFDGWMMSAFPAVAALEHPRYDVRLIECLR